MQQLQLQGTQQHLYKSQAMPVSLSKMPAWRGEHDPGFSIGVSGTISVADLPHESTAASLLYALLLIIHFLRRDTFTQRD